MDKGRIMIVEDEVVVSADLRSKILALGHEVCPIVRYGEAVLETAREHTPDLILMDIRLKGELDGIEAACAVKDHLHIPVIFVTAYSDNATLNRARVAEPFGYLKKPVNANDLEINIKMALYKAHVEQRLRRAQKMEAISTLAGGIAHEFNNALTVVMGRLEILEMDLAQYSESVENLKDMRLSCDRMSRLTRQLLAYARGGKYQAKTMKFDDFVRETLPILGHSLNPGITIETRFQEPVSLIRADRTQLQMVLAAVLQNASEAMDGAGHVRILMENRVVDGDLTNEYPSRASGSYVCLTIEDNGKGMNEEERKKIFDPFFTTKFQGRGMGMAAAYGVVSNHDGWISVDSKSGKGTAIHIYLPAVEIEEIGKAEPPAAEPDNGTGTILLIEDEEMVVLAVQALLKRLGYRVMIAGTGRDAIHVANIHEGEIDLALLDIKLPDMEGGSLYPLLMQARPHLKVIVCSGYAIDGPVRKILDAGAEGFIQKPFRLKALSKKLKAVLAKE